jgi:regulator of cell morphogenesis and NO signaling
MTLLTPKEMLVRDALVQGMTNKEIAGHMCVSVRTVKFHACNVYRKYRVDGRSTLTAQLTGRNIVNHGKFQEATCRSSSIPLHG